MIKFRQKEFNKMAEALKKAAENPVKSVLLVSSPVFGAANLSLNVSKKKKDTELREEQLRAMEELTAALRQSNDLEIRKAANKSRKSFRKKHPEDLKDEDIIVFPNPVSLMKKKLRK